MLNDQDVSRRAFVKAGVATAAAVGLPSGSRAQEAEIAAGEEPQILPRRTLGRTGEKVSILNLGTAHASDARILNATADAGIRYLDTADCYAGGRAEKNVAEWLEKNGRRKEFFIVTKDHPKVPAEWVEMVDNRLEALGIDTIDMFFIHGLGEGYMGGGEDKHRDWPKRKSWAKAAEKIKASGKVRFVGFSTHTNVKLRTALLKNAAKGGWVDAIMVAYDPQLVRENAEFNKALDACHKAGIGLISMKEMKGVSHVSKFLPEFKEMGMTPHQAVLHAVWSDERFSSICSGMPNLRIIRENAEAARNFKPMDEKKVSAVIGLYEKFGTRYCNGCDGRCARAGGTQAALGDIVRYLNYHECDGLRDEARRLYAALSSNERDWRDADLAAASAACVSRLDFAVLLPRAAGKLA